MARIPKRKNERTKSPIGGRTRPPRFPVHISQGPPLMSRVVSLSLSGRESRIDETEWEAGIALVRHKLETVARSAQTITYNDLVVALKSQGLPPRFLGAMLDEIDTTERLYQGRRLRLSAIVVRTRDMHGGAGHLVPTLHLKTMLLDDDTDQRAFWGRQVERVWQAYGRKGDGR